MTAGAGTAIATTGEEAPFGSVDLAGLLANPMLRSPQLRTLCAIMQSSRQPMFVVWGERRPLLYNAAYAVILGDRHPAAFGRPILQVWAEITHEIAPLIDRTYAGESIYMDDIQFVMERHGESREAHFSFSYTPISGDTPGEVLGMFCACTETTDTVMESRLRAAQEARRLRLFEQAPGFIAVLNGPRHVFEFVNASYVRAAGGRALIGRTVRDAFPELEQQGLTGVLDRVYATGQRYIASSLAVELRPRLETPAQTRYLDFVYEPITDAAGTVTGIFVEGSDSTEAVLAQRMLRESDARRAQLLDSMHEGFLILDESFRVLEINAEGARLDGREKAQLLGRTHWELWPATVGTEVESTYRRVMTERVPAQLVHRYGDDRHDLHLELRVYPVTGGVAAFYRDVTALADATDALQRGHDRFRAAIQAIGVLWTNDAGGRMTGPQPGWTELTGQTEAEHTGFGWARAVHPDDAEPTIQAWNRAVAQRSTFTFEHRVRRRDGAWRRFAIRAVPVVTPGGSLREWVGTHIDITDATRVADALRAADRRKDEFLATLAHELRNPLSTIRNAAVLLERPDLPADRLGWVGGVIERQSRTMTILLDELLDLSRFRSGSVALRVEQVEVAALVHAAIESVNHLIDAKQHRLQVRLPDPPAVLNVDPIRTSQVLANLLTNAAKYTDPGGVLQIDVAALDARLRIDVIDNGIGLSAESLTDIFEMFTQVQGARDRSDGGLGIGLTLARRLVELQGGSIEAFSDGLGSGSTFRVTFALAPVAPAD